MINVESLLKFIPKEKGPRIAATIFKNRNLGELHYSILSLNIKLQYQDCVAKGQTHCAIEQNRDLRNIPSQICLIFDKDAKLFQ